jgi:signal transduction histidine kinase
VAGRFPGEAVLLLTELANSAAIAVENARLYGRAEQAATLEERQRIAAEMHDGLAQMISYLGLQVDQAADLVTAGQGEAAVERLQRLRSAAEQASVEVRRAIASLQQDPQRPQSLQDRLARLAADHSEAGGPVIELILLSQEPLMLTTDTCEEVLRVVGEALLNARRHAGARRVGIRMEQAGGEASVTIEDNGCGFDPAALPEGGQHFGLSIMRARAARLGGRLTVASAPGRGTQVKLIWPVKGG